MTLYELFLMLHVMAAIVWLGAGVIFTILTALARSAKDPSREAAYHADAEKLAPIVFIPAAMATFIFGVLAAIEGNWDFDQVWIVIGLGGWLVSFAIGIGYFKPQSELIARLEAEGPAGQAEAMRRSKRMGAVGNLELTMLFTVVAAMSIKPTSDDTGILIVFAVVVGFVAFLNAGALRGEPDASTPTTT